ncbi:AraC family transcriptional regulator [Alicyclobacillus fodiniaquatilis]|uniref:AraC family transcriptional regulator n=1 Tax=Alicyclobacillus fodiniaquatilis TaxID=1661150 RepID=A0ABW4JS32_9BACL
MNQGHLTNFDHHVEYSHTRGDIPKIDFHLHDRCELYFLLAGDVRYFVEKNIYPLSVGDFIMTNPDEIHTPAFASAATYERIFIQLDPRYISQFDSGSYQLLRCFYDRKKGENNKIPLTKVETAELAMLFKRYEQLVKSPPPAANQLKLCCLIEILVFINQRFADHKNHNLSFEVHQKLSPVLDYIDHHLNEDLSLNTLEKELFINKYYLSKLFKKHIGSTLHEYIIYKRLSMAKRYLIEGCSVAEAQEKSGFTDYTSFLKMFKRTVGILPKDYAQHGAALGE